MNYAKIVLTREGVSTELPGCTLAEVSQSKLSLVRKNKPFSIAGFDNAGTMVLWIDWAPPKSISDEVWRG